MRSFGRNGGFLSAPVLVKTRIYDGLCSRPVASGGLRESVNGLSNLIGVKLGGRAIGVILPIYGLGDWRLWLSLPKTWRHL